MIQRTAFPSIVTDLAGKDAHPVQAAGDPGRAGDPAPGQLRPVWRRATAFLSLPGDLRSFALFVAAVGIVSGGMALHILLSAQILAARVELQAMKADYEATMRQNADLIWQIAEATSLPAVVARAQELGYQAPADPYYVVRVTSQEPGAEAAVQAGVIGAEPATVAGERPRVAGSLAWPSGDDGRATQASGSQSWRAWLPGVRAGGDESRPSFAGRWLELLRSRNSP